jgi:hypothetical protein
MIRVNVNEAFPITVALIDETQGIAATGQTVYYDVRLQPTDSALSPPLNGLLTESTVEPGIYTTMQSIDTAGTYLVYATCSGFITNTEEIIVNTENIYEVIKQNRHYNTSVEDVIRTNATPSASQTIRKVGLNKTDYVVTSIKGNSDSDWSGTVASGIVYAWYRNEDDVVPFKMGGPGV